MEKFSKADNFYLLYSLTQGDSVPCVKERKNRALYRFISDKT